MPERVDEFILAISLWEHCLVELLGVGLILRDLVVLQEKISRSELKDFVMAAQHHDRLIDVDCRHALLRWVLEHVFCLILEIDNDYDCPLGKLPVHHFD